MRILFVALAQSVHTARWINQIADQGWDLHVFPAGSPEFHPLLRNVTVHCLHRDKTAHLDKSVRVAGRWPLPRHLLLERTRRLFPTRFEKSQRLARVIEQIQPDIVHSMQFQRGVYLTWEARELLEQPFPAWIVSNWGPDIHYYQQFDEDRSKIRSVLSACDYYDCECERDVRFARDFGFEGEAFPVLPNAGGFDLQHIETLKSPGPSSQRRIVLVKGKQGKVSCGLTALEAVERCADVLGDYKVVIYSAEPEVVEAAEHIQSRTSLSIEFASGRGLAQLSHEEMLRLHGQARMSIGICISDGVAISFLEALAMGSFPIQTNTACADEWIVDGEGGFIVEPDDLDGIVAAIRRAATDDALVDRAAEINAVTTRERLDYGRIQAAVIEMYEHVYRQGKVRWQGATEVDPVQP